MIVIEKFTLRCTGCKDEQTQKKPTRLEDFDVILEDFKGRHQCPEPDKLPGMGGGQR